MDKEMLARKFQMLPLAEHFSEHPDSYEGLPVYPIVVPRMYDMNEEFRLMIRRSNFGLREGKEPKKPPTGAGGSYLIPGVEVNGHKYEEYASVFKPYNEEPNQEFYSPKPKTRQRKVAPGMSTSIPLEGLKEGTRAGGGAAREFAAYLLDHPKTGRRKGLNGEVLGSAGVPPTLPMYCINKNFNYLSSKTKTGEYRYTREHYKFGSLQMYMPHNGNLNPNTVDVQALNFAVEEVHKISVIDIRYANVDRHPGNLLYHQVQEGETSRTVLIPIDHGYCFPEKFAINDFVWLKWEQARYHFSEEFKDYIRSLDAEEDIALLEKFKFNISYKSCSTLRLSTLLLKKSVEKGLTPFQIGKIMCRNGSSRRKTKSFIEMIAESFENDCGVNLKELWDSNSSKVVEAFGKAFDKIVSTRLEKELSNDWVDEKVNLRIEHQKASSSEFQNLLTCAKAQIAAAFYPKFENLNNDQAVRGMMINMVSEEKGALEVTLKHSGSLFIYAGKEGGAYTKNSFGNKYTAVGLFVLRRTFLESWGTEAATTKQRDFDELLKEKQMCISMELVTAVLGDHGQHPKKDYVVVTAVTELGVGKPRFYSTPELIAFCREWRLPTNNVWLFSKRDSVETFFRAFDELCEEGTTTTVCAVLDDESDFYLRGSKDHSKVQGEILEGLVARVVSPEILKHMEKVFRENPPTLAEGDGLDFGPSLRDIFGEHKSNESKFVQSLCHSVGADFFHNNSDWKIENSVVTQFLNSRSADSSTSKLQDMTRLLKSKYNEGSIKFIGYKRPSDTSTYKMVIQVKQNKVFKDYRKMSEDKVLWPLFRGFYVDIKIDDNPTCACGDCCSSPKEIGNLDEAKLSIGFVDDDANLMIKLKFLKYKIRTFLIRGGLETLFKKGRDVYLKKCSSEMKRWNVSSRKQDKLKEMLAEWADHIQQRCGQLPLLSTEYLTEAEPFLEEYAKKSQENQALVGLSSW